MADVSLDKTDPNILKIRPISDDLLTKFQLERPIILAYKVTTPEAPFTIQIVAQSTNKTYVDIPYTITSITGIWYYKYEDIMDDKQRFVRESRIIKGDLISGYTFSAGRITFSALLASRKVWIEGVGKASGYLQASESTLEPIGDFKIKRLNVYSETRQRVIPYSGSYETPTGGDGFIIVKGSGSQSSDYGGDSWGDDQQNCVCGPGWAGDGWSSAGGHYSWAYSNLDFAWIVQNGRTREQLFTISASWRAEERHDRTWQAPCCFPCLPRIDTSQETQTHSTISENSSYMGSYLTNAICSSHNPNKYVVFYNLNTDEHMEKRYLAGYAEIWIPYWLLICWAFSGDDCLADSQELIHTITSRLVRNIGGSSAIFRETYRYERNRTSYSRNGEQAGCSSFEVNDVETSTVSQFYKRYLKCQYKNFTDTQDAILGCYWWNNYRTVINNGVSQGTSSQWEAGPNVFLYDTHLVEKNWGQQMDLDDAGKGEILGMETYFELTYVRI